MRDDKRMWYDTDTASGVVICQCLFRCELGHAVADICELCDE